jgi:hypothetical protein
MRTSRSRNDGDAAAGEALAATLAYAGRGWPVFPCRGKRPHVKNGLHDAATDRLTVERWWTRIWPGANVAIRAGSESGLLVLDVDGEAGADALAALEREHAELGATVECLTGGGGRHLYFAHPGGELRNSAGRLAPGLDVRGDGGYVIAPPSRHSSGGRYEWSVDGHPDELEPAQAPAWLLEGLRARRNGTAPPVGEAIPEGARNAELASLAGTMRRRGMDEAAIRAALRETNRLRCRPPLDEGEVASIAASITRYRPQRGAPERTQQDVAAREAVPFALDVVSARELCALPDPPQSDELLGPMLVRGGRLVLGGGTGEGKPTLALALVRAVALRREFLQWEGGGGRALVIDAEQGLKTVKRRLREAGLDGSELVDYVRVPDGLSLDSDPAHIAAVEAQLEEGGYSVVLADPLYKLHTGDSNAEREAVDLMRRFDGWRERLRFALMLPVHIRKPPAGAKFTLHEFFGSSAYLRGAEVIVGLQRVRVGYARLHFFKDRDGDLPVGERWGLLFDREQGYRRDPDDEKPQQNATGRVRELLEAQPGMTQRQLIEATRYAERTVRKALRELDATNKRAGSNGERLFELPEETGR